MCIDTTVVVGLCYSIGLLLTFKHCIVSSTLHSWASSLPVANNLNTFGMLNVFRVGIGEYGIITSLILLLHFISAPNCHSCPIPCSLGRYFLLMRLFSLGALLQYIVAHFVLSLLPDDASMVFCTSCWYDCPPRPIHVCSTCSNLRSVWSHFADCSVSIVVWAEAVTLRAWYCHS